MRSVAPWNSRQEERCFPGLLPVVSGADKISNHTLNSLRSILFCVLCHCCDTVLAPWSPLLPDGDHWGKDSLLRLELKNQAPDFVGSNKGAPRLGVRKRTPFPPPATMATILGWQAFSTPPASLCTTSTNKVSESPPWKSFSSGHPFFTHHASRSPVSMLTFLLSGYRSKAWPSMYITWTNRTISGGPVFLTASKMT